MYFSRLPFWENFQLDIVGFLAVLGEGSIQANASVSSLSKLIYLPRLLPAPHALMRPTRHSALPFVVADVAAVYSGNHKAHVHHVASILLDNDKLKDEFTVRCVRVKKLRTRDDEAGNENDAQPVKAKTKGPLAVVTILGCAFSIGLLVASAVYDDGMSLIATLLLSFLSTLIGISNKSTLKLPKRRDEIQAPDGDVVIRYPNGSFLVVKCDEFVARELYFAPERIHYMIAEAWEYRLISLVGTMMLMLGVIALANAKVQLQIGWAAAYILLNAAYWVVAALPQRWHWDLSCFEVCELGIDGGPTNKTFTQALWKAILVTKSTEWVRIGKAAPDTAAWKQWVREAEAQSKTVGRIDGKVSNPKWRPAEGKGNIYAAPSPEWNPGRALGDLMKSHALDEKV